MSFSVLVVEDDELMRMIINVVLQQNAELTVYEAASCRQALEYCSAALPVDLVLLDNFLGDGEGIDLVPQLAKGLKNRTGHPPAIMMLSGNDDSAFLNRCFNQGVADYVIKPFNLELLSLKVSTLLREQALQIALDERNSELQRLLDQVYQEEQLARFIYDFILERATRAFPGLEKTTRSPHAFSGDLILSAEAPDGRGVVMVLDATGHGLSAAITLLPMVSTFQAMMTKGFGLSSILLELNRRLLQDTPQDRFVAAIALEVNSARNEVAIWNGGMPPLLAVGCDGLVLDQVKSSHLALGILGEADFDVTTTTFPLCYCRYWLAYSDGLYEQRNGEGQPLGRASLVNHLKEEPTKTFEQLWALLDQHAGGQGYDDDITICAIDTEAFSQEHNNQTEATMAAEFRLPVHLQQGDFQWSLRLEGGQLCRLLPPTYILSLLAEWEIPQQLSQQCFMVLSELLNNALDHGVMGLKSCLKLAEGGFLAYAEERERRLATLTEEDWVVIEVEWYAATATLWITVQDSGAGFDLDQLGEAQQEALFGRGLAMVQQAAAEVQITPPGNHIRVALGNGTKIPIR